MSNKRGLGKETIHVYTMKSYITTKNDVEEMYVLTQEVVYNVLLKKVKIADCIEYLDLFGEKNRSVIGSEHDYGLF